MPLRAWEKGNKVEDSSRSEMKMCSQPCKVVEMVAECFAFHFAPHPSLNVRSVLLYADETWKTKRMLQNKLQEFFSHYLITGMRHVGKTNNILLAVLKIEL
jgi:hypothetical protein